MAALAQRLGHDGVDRGVEARLDWMGIDDHHAHHGASTGNISREALAPPPCSDSVMMRESNGRASASPAPVPGFTAKAENDEGCKDRRSATPVGTVAQSARMATI